MKCCKKDKTGVVCISLNKDRDFIIEDVTTLQVWNNGKSMVAVNGLSIMPLQQQTIVVPDGSITKVELSVVFGIQILGLDEFGEVPLKDPFPYLQKKNVELIYKKIIPCEN